MMLDFHKSSYSNAFDNCVEVAEISPRFRKSSYSDSQENCLEVADLPTGAAVRDSKDPEAGHLAFAAREWGAFLRAVRRGAFDN
ncbi:DUF397 domain-containing protein [Allosalinactinospora lopnorensis]|uniref:DUF397 domain-containing protein n=1 Tax=Allosalinactinospora lopnorensis TaxID=1352348 RepID=UPI000623EADB|nr:DUF397 domain-containing protein [Allosalinactinospora lopnorensis]